MIGFCFCRRLLLAAWVFCAAWPIAQPVWAQETASPISRSIADITAILDKEKPDPTATAKLRAAAEAQPKGKLSTGEMARFFYSRTQVKAQLGDYRGAIADCEKAVEYAKGGLEHAEYGRVLQGLALQYGYAGDTKKSLDTWLRLAREMDTQGTRGFLFNSYRNIGQLYITLGDFRQAQAYADRSVVLLREAQGIGRPNPWSGYSGFRRAWWHGDVERGNANIYEARGQYREAEAALKKVETWWTEGVRLPQEGPPVPTDQLVHARDLAIAILGRVKARQGRMAEGEADVRRALLSRLKVTGKYNLQTAKFIGYLAGLLIEQDRLADAERLAQALVEIHQVLGVPGDASASVTLLSQLASIFNLQNRWEEAAKAYADLDKATAAWAPARREGLILSTNQIATLYTTNNVAAGLDAAQRLLQRQKTLLGEGHLDTALARGMLAIGLVRTGRDAEAEREFQLAVPILAKSSRESDIDDAVNNAARDQRMALVIEAYIALLARKDAPDAAEQTLRLADLIRGRAVQNALAASSTRAVARNPALAELARKQQDLERQVVAQLGVLNNVLALPSGERDDKAVDALKADIEKLRTARDAAKRDLTNRFRDYANLVEPQPATADDLRKVLAPDEAFLSFYFGREASFVWAVSKEAPVAFKKIDLTAGELEGKVKLLRESFGGDVIQPFDVELAHSLYISLLEPVAQVWRPAKTLTIATNAALGLLPLGLLPTAPSSVATEPGADRHAGYRAVPWLARTHAVTMVPSGASLRALRQLPPGSTKRDALIGFGDPFFTKQQAEAATKIVVAEQTSPGGPTVRGVPERRRALRRSADEPTFSDLLPLPDTAEELKSTAAALAVDPAQALHLGKEANERKVKTMDLSRYRFVAFATHGLIPPQLGLTQPAIALTAPEVAGIDGDGLLTMEEVLALKLDADWVLLSACNSGAGAVEGAEAVSGLGRAFFYAGTRALLVTNWEVDSLSARDLVTGIFGTLAADPTLSRTEALRRAMLALMDGPGLPGQRTYAHPYFWAAYSVIGDGGGGR